MVASLTKMAWKPLDCPSDRHSREWGRWMFARKSAKARRLAGRQVLPPPPLTREERAARDAARSAAAPATPAGTRKTLPLE